MEIQTLLALAVVVAAALYMVRRLVRTMRTTRPDSDGAGCASGCGCETGGGGAAETRATSTHG